MKPIEKKILIFVAVLSTVNLLIVVSLANMDILTQNRVNIAFGANMVAIIVVLWAVVNELKRERDEI